MSLLTRLRPSSSSSSPDDPASPDDPEAAAESPRSWRPVVARVVTVLAGLLVLFALLLPNQPDQLSLAGFLRIPAEGLLGAALLLALPAGRLRAVAAVVLGALLGLLVILKAIDVGFYTVLDRPFDPLFDWPMFSAGATFLRGSIGETAATLAVAGTVVLAVGLPALLAFSVRRLARPLARYRTRAAGVVGVLGAGWLACALLAVQIVPGAPVAQHEYDRINQLGASLRDHEEFLVELASDDYLGVPGADLLTSLRGKDVVVAFIESYGRDAVEDPEFAPEVGAVLADGGQRLEAAGFGSRSAFLTSPTAGGASWFAHATLLAGVWVENQDRYATLVNSDRLTLNRAFQRAGWRTVAVAPGVSQEWTESGFFGYDRIYDAHHMGFEGERDRWAAIPDQYALSAFQRFERDREDREPVMAEIPLISSHAPWTPIPPLLDWDDVGNGSIFDTATKPGPDPEKVLSKPSRARTEYRKAIEYSLRTLISYMETYGDDDLVLILLGDHQPSPMITGNDASRDVPITVVSGDQAVLDRINGWGWQAGLHPGAEAPVWRMDAFRNRFLSTFGSPAG